MKFAILISIIALIPISLASAALVNEISYSVKIDFENNGIFINSVKLVEGAASKAYKYDPYEYELKLISFKNEIIDSKKFNLPLYAEDIGKKVTKGSIAISLPYHSEGQMIVLAKDGKDITQIDVKYLATCNQNDFCESLETKTECPEDCTKNIEPKEIIEAAQEERIEEMPAANRLVFVIAALLLIIILLIYFARKVGNKR